MISRKAADNRRKVETLRPGSRWHAQTVIRIMRRLGMTAAGT
jgi:hypothetical protein